MTVQEKGLDFDVNVSSVVELDIGGYNFRAFSIGDTLFIEARHILDEFSPQLTDHDIDLLFGDNGFSGHTHDNSRSPIWEMYEWSHELH